MKVYIAVFRQYLEDEDLTINLPISVHKNKETAKAAAIEYEKEMSGKVEVRNDSFIIEKELLD